MGISYVSGSYYSKLQLIQVEIAIEGLLFTAVSNVKLLYAIIIRALLDITIIHGISTLWPEIPLKSSDLIGYNPGGATRDWCCPLIGQKKPEADYASHCTRYLFEQLSIVLSRVLSLAARGDSAQCFRSGRLVLNSPALAPHLRLGNIRTLGPTLNGKIFCI